MTLTPREAAFVADSTLLAVERAVDGGVVPNQTQTVAGRKTRVLGHSELRFFSTLRSQENALTLAGRRLLYEAVQHPQDGKATLGPFVVDVRKVDLEIERRFAELNQLKGRVEEGTDGDPVVKGTAVPVHVVAALATDGGVEAACRAYPSLPRTAIETAVAYAAVYPKRGRPYPARSMKQMLSELALPDEVFGEAAAESGPREVRL